MEGDPMDVFSNIRTSLVEILDIEATEITPETYLVRDLGAESIDLLELSVALNSTFKVEINEDDLFLRTLRICLNEAQESQSNAESTLGEKFPFLERDRIGEILTDLDGGPVLKVKDLMAYISWQVGGK
jgi:acyl carrier protein